MYAFIYTYIIFTCIDVCIFVDNVASLLICAASNEKSVDKEINACKNNQFGSYK